MKKRLQIVLLILVCILIISCKGKGAGTTPTDTAAAAKMVQSGTQGVEISVMPNQPPALVYDQNELVAMVEVKNKGNHDLLPQDCFVQVSGFDQNIIRGMQAIHSCAETQDQLDGKSLYNTEGGYNLLEFRAPNVELPAAVFEYNPTLNFVTCYNYHTVASPQVCVDPQMLKISPQQKSCIPRSVGTGGGQGGPVGISNVGVNMVGRKAIFDITVVNLAGGRVLSPYSDLRSCTESSFQYTDLDTVAYNVNLQGGSLLDCQPRSKLVKLVGNTGKIVCKFEIGGGQAFETPLSVELDYNYVQSMSRSLKIIKTPQ